MKLSVDNINDKSPYWVLQLDDMQFRFRTRFGIVYHVGFYPDSYFMPGAAYHFYIANIHNIKGPRDPQVFHVISLVLEEFFKQDDSVMLYICDPADHKESVRSGLYQRWFDNYEKKEELILKTSEMNFSGNIVYSGLIIRKSNPDSQLILTSFDNFTKKAPLIYNVKDK